MAAMDGLGYQVVRSGQRHPTWLTPLSAGLPGRLPRTRQDERGRPALIRQRAASASQARHWRLVEHQFLTSVNWSVCTRSEPVLSGRGRRSFARPGFFCAAVRPF